jgi:uncharacterized membrane-anchored protein YitT (DUF2179 family)
MVIFGIYLSIYLIVASFRIQSYPNQISAMKICIASLFYPISVMCFLLNIPLNFFGVYLQYKTVITVSKEILEEMTDNDEL